MAVLSVQVKSYKDFAFKAAVIYGLDIDVDGYDKDGGKFTVYGDRPKIERLVAQHDGKILSDHDVIAVDKLD